jgi:uncharacterized repeat protein (TIGR01451 family)
MNRISSTIRLGFIIIFFFLFGITSSTRADSSPWSAPRPAPGMDASPSSTYQTQNSPDIYLAYATFDPLISMPSTPSNLTYSSEEISASGTYILQFNAPVREEWKAALIELGVRIGDYIPDYAFLVYMDPGTRMQVESLPYVRWVGPYQPAYKLSPQVDFTDKRSYRIYLAPWADMAGIDKDLAAIDANRSMEAQGATAVLDGEGLQRVAQMSQVLWIEPNYLNQLHNDVAAGAIMDASVSWSSGYTGSGNTIAVTDSGLDTGDPSKIHADFSGRVTQIHSWPVQNLNWGGNCIPINAGANDGAADLYSGHGSHVTGSLAGSGAASSGKFKGSAYQADITFQAVEQWTDWPAGCDIQDGFYITGIPSDLRTLLSEVYNWGARVQNYSWGGGKPGEYDSQASQVDDFIFSHPDFTLLASAGNDGVDWDEDGYADADSIKSPGIAKNLITIGASDNERTSGGIADETWYAVLGIDFHHPPTSIDYTSDDRNEMVAFSSRGPADDGRIKPDLVAPGTNIISVRSSRATLTGWGIYNTYYMYYGGTSMSSPLAAGAATLVRDYYRTTEGHSNPSAALLKATLINSAVDIYGYKNLSYEAGLPIPNAHEGWGLINVGAATTPGKREFIDETAGLSTGASEVRYFNILSYKPFKVTLVWSDYPGSPTASKALVNDLNLRVTDPSGSIVYWGNQFLGGWSRSGGLPDSKNNVENVYIKTPAAGLWKVEVIGQNVAKSPQPYALVIDGEIGIKPPLRVTSITPAHAFTGDTINDAIILGEGIEPEVEVRLIQGTKIIPATNVIADPIRNRITADFNLTGAAVGWWDVQVKNISSGETASLHEGFYVKDRTLPDVAIEKVPFASKIESGSNLTYTIAIENIGYVTATGVVFTDTLPIDVDFESLSPECEGGLTTLFDGFSCAVQPITLTAGASIDYTLVVSVPEGLNDFITNQVEVTSLETDAYLLNNQASASVLSGILSYYLPFTVKHYSPTAPVDSAILNGDFENGPDGSWIEQSSNDFSLILDEFSPTTITPHAGQWAVWLGGWEDEISSISQQVFIPPGKKLSFWYWSASEETSCGLDTAYVKVGQTVIGEINLCASQDSDRWIKRTLDLSAFTGRTINLMFSVQTNDSLNSNLFLDDVSFE